MSLNFKAWRYFILSILVAGVIAGVINTVLAPAQMTKWARELLIKNNGHGEFQLQRAEASLADGIWPEWALNLHGLSWRNQRACALVDEVSSHRLKVRFKLWSLLTGELAFDKILLSHVNLRIHPNGCKKMVEPGDSLKGAGQTETKLAESDSIFTPIAKLSRKHLLPEPTVKKQQISKGGAWHGKAKKKLAKKTKSNKSRHLKLGSKSQTKSSSEANAEVLLTEGQLSKQSIFVAEVGKKWPLLKPRVKALWEERVRPLKGWFNFIEIDQLVIEEAVNDQKKVTFEDMLLTWNGGKDSQSLKLTGRLTLAPHLVLNEPVKAFDIVSVIGPKGIDMSLKGRYYEGSVTAQALLDIKNNSYKVELEMNQLPLDQLTSALSRGQVLPFPFAPKLTWLSCKIHSQGSFLKLSQTKIKMSPCGIVGGLGQLKLTELIYEPFLPAKNKLSSFTIKVTDLDVGQLIKGIGRVGPSGIFSDFGRINGLVEWSDKNNIQINGVAEDMVLYFSNRGERAHQKVMSLAMNMALAEDRFSGKLTDVKIDQGDFVGELSFNMDRTMREGVLQVNIDKFQVNSAIQRLMVAGKLEPLAIYGKAKILDGEIVRWRGDVGSKGIKSKFWQVSKIKIKTDFKDLEMKGHLEIEQMVFEDSHSYQSWMLPLLLTEEKSKTPLAFKKVAANMVFKRNEGQWSQASLDHHAGHIVIRSQGTWKKNSDDKGKKYVDVDGQVLVAKAGFKPIRWKISGELGELKVFPDSRDLKAMSKVEKKGKRIGARQKPFLDEIFENTPVQFQSIKEKVLKSANQWMGREPGVKANSKKGSEANPKSEALEKKAKEKVPQ